MQIPAMIERELRVQSRSWATRWLRVLAAGAAASTLAVALVLAKETAVLGGKTHGPWLFALLHTALSAVLATSCPLLCADSLARERREGTLGLLLLTPLRPSEIVLGKMATHLLRAFTLWLSVTPVLVVPLLVGGIAGADIGFALALEGGVVLGSIAAGFLASSLTEKWGSAIGLATVLAILIGEGLALLSFVGFAPLFVANERAARGEMLFLVAFVGPWILGTGLLGPGGFSGMLAQSPPWMDYALLTALAMVVLGSLVAIILSWRFASRRVQRFGRACVSAPRQEAARCFWFKPRLTLWKQARRKSSLRSNPMIWLYTFDPSVRLVRWLWCGFVLAVWGGVLIAGIDEDDTEPWVFGLPLVLIIGLALSAAASFRRELEEGTIELLLVTPLRPAAILSARLLTLWTDFLPSMLLSMALAGWWMGVHGAGPVNVAILVIAVSSFLTAPLVGARLSVRRISPITGWFWTLGLSGGLPATFGMAMALLAEPAGYYGLDRFHSPFVLVFVVVQCLQAGLCAWATASDLGTRQFQLKPLQRVPG
jgi:ABC-type transport system involved in multi-copper enzyme maturation permease subunit